jgi:hypothetical protein
MLVIYRSLLRLYPAAHFREYAAEMTWVFTQANEAVRNERLRARMLFRLREVVGLVGGAVHQRLFGSCDWNSSRRFAMRPEFRFPRSTIFLMWVILAGLMLAIAEAKKIAMQYGPADARSVWTMLPGFIVWAVVLVAGAGAAVWGILFALRRTGVQRLENLDTGSGN